MRTPDTPPVIAKVATNVHRPTWSVMIPAYNCIGFLQYTIESVLKQDLGADTMQIEVIDDCSTDGDVAGLVKKIGGGRVGYYRQEKNVGSLRNFETCLNRSKGVYVHLLHGDDVVKDGFYSEINTLFEENPSAGAAFTKYTYINEKGEETEPGKEIIANKRGIVEGWLYKIAKMQYIQPPSIVVKRSVYEHLGSFYGVHYGEDWEMWIRIAAHYPVAYSPACLALYRTQTSTKENITNSSIRTGQNIKDVLKVISSAQAYFPKEKRKQVAKAAKKNFSSHYAKEAAHNIYVHSPETALVLAKGALQLQINARVVFWLTILYIKHFFSVFKFRK